MSKAGDKKRREIIEKIIIKETKDDSIVWSVSNGVLNDQYTAMWNGWRLTANYLQDETSFKMFKPGHPLIEMSHKVMDGLRNAIRDQLDPLWLEKEAAHRVQLKKEAGESRAKEAGAIDEILGHAKK